MPSHLAAPFRSPRGFPTVYSMGTLSTLSFQICTSVARYLLNGTVSVQQLCAACDAGLIEIPFCRMKGAVAGSAAWYMCCAESAETPLCL